MSRLRIDGIRMTSLGRDYDGFVAGGAAEAHAADRPPSEDGRSRRFRPLKLSDARSWSVRLAGRREFQAHLATMPVFAGCTRRQMWRLARWGDVIEVPSGAVLAREDRSNHWFFVILAGSVKVTHRKRDVATLRRGGHFGEIAVIGFRPQPATVTATEKTVLFVLGRRQFVSLAAMDRAIQHALF